MNAPSAQPPRFGDTTLGKIVIGLVTAAGGALISYVVAAYTLSITPPIAEINPTEVEAKAGETVEFSAAGSRDPDGGELRFEWRLGGVPLGRSPVGACTIRDNSQVVGCRFVTPGTFALGVTVASDAGLTSSAAASVTVRVDGGYIGFVLLGSSTDEAYRELIYGVDWVALQSLVSLPIVLHDPDTAAPVYAASFVGADEHRAIVRPTGALAGVKLLLPRLPPDARDAFEIALARLGASPVVMPAGEIMTAVTRGVADGGAIIIDSPAGLGRIAAELGGGN